MAADLEAMRTLVRRLTRSPSANQLTDDDIDEYINTFYQYDLPEELRLFKLKKTLKFWTVPNVDSYASDAVEGLEDFDNAIISVEPPAYISGNEAYVTMSREEFFLLYPITTNRVQIGTGDGATSAFSGTLADVPVMQNRVAFVSRTSDYNNLVMKDEPAIPKIFGNNTAPLVENGDDVEQGEINYITGAYDFTFTRGNTPTPPASGAIIEAHTRPYVAALPDSILYYSNTFTLRPVPDKPYEVIMNAYVKPTALTDPTDQPELDQWWQYLAYGGAKKVFEGRGDIDSVQIIMPEMQRQERLALRKTLVQRSWQQASTIYNMRGQGYPYDNTNQQF